MYPCFQHWPGTIWFYSDPHFSDEHMYQFRKGITDEEQVKRINSKVGKNGTIIFLGDVGNLEFVKKLKGYKVLIMGNHERGRTNYERVQKKVVVDASRYTQEGAIDFMRAAYTDYEVKFICSGKAGWIFDIDNRLFDEVYEGTLQISPKIILSHEPIDYEYCLNIHGHDHSGADFVNHVLKYYDADMPLTSMIDNYLETIKTDKLTKLNVCAEWINYTPINIERLIKSGILHSIPDVHRHTIDEATLRKMKKNQR